MADARRLRGLRARSAAAAIAWFDRRRLPTARGYPPHLYRQAMMLASARGCRDASHPSCSYLYSFALFSCSSHHPVLALFSFVPLTNLDIRLDSASPTPLRHRHHRILFRLRRPLQSCLRHPPSASASPPSDTSATHLSQARLRLDSDVRYFRLLHTLHTLNLHLSPPPQTSLPCRDSASLLYHLTQTAFEPGRSLLPAPRRRTMINFSHCPRISVRSLSHFLRRPMSAEPRLGGAYSAVYYL
ncbi:hypothetical protein FB451DRAFT_1568742 [Mycena latifolia]|nr:hypothetical protein FB451DRAFT_1568742 [Mycena latifolia]